MLLKELLMESESTSKSFKTSSSSAMNSQRRKSTSGVAEKPQHYVLNAGRKSLGGGGDVSGSNPDRLRNDNSIFKNRNDLSGFNTVSEAKEFRRRISAGKELSKISGKGLSTSMDGGTAKHLYYYYARHSRVKPSNPDPPKPEPEDRREIPSVSKQNVSVGGVSENGRGRRRSDVETPGHMKISSVSNRHEENRHVPVAERPEHIKGVVDVSPIKETRPRLENEVKKTETRHRSVRSQGDSKEDEIRVLEKRTVESVAVSVNARVRAADMPRDMQIHAFRFASLALEKQQQKKGSAFRCKDVAYLLKKEFDKVYGPAWHCIVGTSFGSFVTHTVGGFLYFSLDKTSILLFKTAVEALP